MTVAARIGTLMTKFYEHLLDLPNLAAVFPGDDMGFKTGPLVSPDDLRALVLPWHTKFAAMAHARGLPYFLHSCGNLETIIGDLIGRCRHRRQTFLRGRDMSRGRIPDKATEAGSPSLAGST